MARPPAHLPHHAGYSAVIRRREAPNGPPLIRELTDRVFDRLRDACSRLLQGTRAASDEGPRPRGAVTAQLGPEHTVDALSRSLALQPHNCLAWFQLGIVHLEHRAFEEAAEAFTQARCFGFNSFELSYYLAEALQALQRHEQAVDELYRALEKQPRSAESSYRLGLSLHELLRYDEAVAAFEIAVSLSPNTVKYHQSLGLALEQLGRQDEALRSFKQAVQLERELHR